MTTIDSGRTSFVPGAARFSPEHGEEPTCSGCHSSEYLIFEEFIPARQADHSTELLPPSVSYTCSECGTFNAHTVPAAWRPPQWFWYS